VDARQEAARDEARFPHSRSLEGRIVQLRENVTLKSNDKAYAWVNPLQIWATGTANLKTGEIRVSGYRA